MNSTLPDQRKGSTSIEQLVRAEPPKINGRKLPLPHVPVTSLSCRHLFHHGDRYECGLGGACDQAYRNLGHLEECRRGFEPVARKIEGLKLPTLSLLRQADNLCKCTYLGKPTGELVKCTEGCGKGTNLKVFACGIHGRTTIDKFGVDVPTKCSGCPDKCNVPNAIIKLPPGPDQGHFNGSHIYFQGKRLFASRFRWAGSRIFLHELGHDWQPISSRDLQVQGSIYAGWGAEDPRLFVHGGKLHVAVTNYEPQRTGATSQAVVRLNDKLEVEDVRTLQYAKRTAWEKNWAFFEHEQKLLCVYSIQPHVVLEVNGADAKNIANVAHRFRILGAEMRGGAPPVRVGDEYYHWFHTARAGVGNRQYGLGLYTFTADGDFAPRRAIPTLIFEPEKPRNLDRAVVFPGGAVLKDGQWEVSCGWHDQGNRVLFFDAAEIEGRLRQI